MDQSITVAATVGKVETAQAEEVDIGHIEGEKILIGTCDFINVNCCINVYPFSFSTHQ